ncbi:MAG: autotransporter assembly complex family protein [Amaricoccus sp.]
MRRKRQVGTIVGLAMGSAMLVTTPADAFSLFGFHLWGKPETDDRVEVIDPLPYKVDFEVSGQNDALKGILTNASALWTNRDEPASGKAGLISRAKGDYRRLLAALYDAGYYGGQISITLAGAEAADLTLAVDFPKTVPVAIQVIPGPIFTFGALREDNPPAASDLGRQRGPTFESIGYSTGQTAKAGAIGKASALSITQWRNQGHAKAKEAGRDVVADHTNDRLDVTLSFDPGRLAHYGPLTVKGNSRTRADFIAFMTDLPEGQRFDAEQVKRSETRLGRLGIFRSLRIEEAPEIRPDGSLPMTVAVEDRRPRTLGFGGTYSTIDGLGVEAYWLHRNLLGAGERLRFDASIAGLGVAVTPDDLDYKLGVSFTKPGVYTPDTSLVAAAQASQLDYDNYREKSVSATLGASHQFNDFLVGDLAGGIQRARFDDIFGIRTFQPVGLIGNLTYDTRNDPLDASRGYFLQAMVNPFYEMLYKHSAIRGTIEGRAYRSLIGLDKLVLAGRVKVGSYYGPGASESPPDLLFFAGGGGSVRGYAYRSIGVPYTNPETGESGTVGGRGLFEGSAEARYRINDSFGAAAFLDSGFVSANPRFAGENELRFGTGFGVRYYTGLGPLRFDVATPLERRSGDPYVALYIGIGQAF